MFETNDVSATKPDRINYTLPISGGTSWLSPVATRKNSQIGVGDSTIRLIFCFRALSSKRAVRSREEIRGSKDVRRRSSQGISVQAHTREILREPVTEEKDVPNENQGDPTLYRPDLVNPRLRELRQQKIKLKDTGVELSLIEASTALTRLRDMQQHQPDQFQTLVAIVKPRGARKSFGEVVPKALKSLKKHGIVGSDGTPDSRFAAVLDSAYLEPAEGVILRDPVDYPGPEFTQELTRLEAENGRQVVRLLAEEFKRPKGRDGGEGPGR
jgi:hypothetical protein